MTNGAGAAAGYGALAAPAPAPVPNLAQPAMAEAQAPSAPGAAPFPGNAAAGRLAASPAVAPTAPVSAGSAFQTTQVLDEPLNQAAASDKKNLDLASDELQAPVLPRSLPSRLGAISSAHSGARVLAIDTHNAVFLSVDSGRHWKPVAVAWQGRAVKAGLVSQAAAYAPVAGMLAGGNMPSFSGGSQTLAKEAKARLTGTVTDASGAVIPGATIAVTDAATNTAHTVTTGPDGRYLADGLAPGSYNLAAQATGFEIQNLRGVFVEASRPNVANLKLQVGAATETVTVEARGAEPKVSTAPFASAAAQGAPQAVPVFEITTDTGSRWTSTDGLTWKHE